MPRKMDPFYDSFGTLQARTPSPLERIVSQLSQLAYGNDERAGTQNMLSLLGSSGDQSPEGKLRNSLNPLSALWGAYDSGQDIGKGNYLAGTLGLAAAALPGPAKKESKEGLEGLARLISSQGYLNEDIVSAKLANQDFGVSVSPVFQLGGKSYRVVTDGHHSFEAARRAGVEPELVEQSVSDNDTIEFLNRGLVDDFLQSQRNDSDYFDIKTKKSIW